jgi:hypothetical protein
MQGVEDIPVNWTSSVTNDFRWHHETQRLPVEPVNSQQLSFETK